jgi:holliday junction DNA helicase RuvA
MITKISGKLVELGAAEATIEVGAFEYQVLVPEFVRRRLQESLGETVSLRTLQYIDGNIQKGGRMTPRLIGFLSAAEQEFFEMICSVDGVGVKKALLAMVRPVRDVAAAIEEQDAKTLTTLPGIGPAVADRIIAKLRRKMTRFALMPDRGLPAEQQNKPDILSDGFEALVALGHTPTDARKKIEAAVAAKGKFKSVDELINEVYRQEHG